ncbi:HIT-like protein [Lentinula detonsa]|uniref:HIT-like protein n=1 Tax=Lentinula detonsa TaxID=2804962 RepID=A0A9W8TZQ4_9AGAR|nr:HIT-like protein [Lentinula detonsa]KAJ3983574.1 HIT-like protein [Lentinula detonsa]
MTSFIIRSHTERPPHPWKKDVNCAFCSIINNKSPSNCVFENDKVIAFLDIMPLRKGHTLVVPKVHYSRLSDLPPEYAAAIGEAVSKVAHALTQALGNAALNVVCNQEYAQAVPHVHYHIIPAPSYESSKTSPPSKIELSKDKGPPLTRREMHRMEFEGREELDDEDGVALVKLIRARL